MNDASARGQHDQGSRAASQGRASARSVLIEVLGFAAACAVFFGVSDFISGDAGTPLTLGALLLPLFMAAAVRALGLIYLALRSRLSNAAATVGIALGIVATVGVIILMGLTVGSVTVASHSGIGMLAAAVGYGALAWIAARVWPRAAEVAPAQGPLADDEWLRALGRELRARGDQSDARVRETVAAAAERGAAVGRPLAAELGSPKAYAERFTVDRVRIARRRAGGMTVLAGLVIASLAASILGEMLSVWNVVLAALMITVAILEWRVVGHETRAAATRDSVGN